MRVLMIDTETTGLDFANDRIIEIGAMIVDEDFNAPVDTLSLLMWDPSYPNITPEITDLTGITMDELLDKGQEPKIVFSKLLSMLVTHGPGFVVAYNEDFDRRMIAAEIERMQTKIPFLTDTQWLCAMTDNAPNYKKKCWKLSHLALDHGVPVNPKELHRASDDIELTRKMLKATGATAKSLFDFKSIPWVYLKASTTEPWKDNGKSNKRAIELGYSWQKARGDYSGKEFTKLWVKRVKENEVKNEIEKSTIPVSIIKE